ncbi:hypothetical protein L0F63_004496 [Massospora cicadina]|nr:hypothetical protein L0F63_004496 [Massospora cicadina]
MVPLTVIELLVELILIVAGIILNGLLALVTYRRSRINADRDVILTMSILDLVSGVSQCALNSVSLMYDLFGIVVLRMDALGMLLQMHASMVLMPAALLGLILATLLGMARCAVIVFGCRVTHIGTVAIISCSIIMILHTISYLSLPTFYGVIFHADTRNPTERPLDWYTLFGLVLISVCLLAVTISYGLLTRHYYLRKRLCDLRGKPLRAPIVSLVVVTTMYSVAILPRIVTIIVTQIFCKDLIWDSHFMSLSLLIFLPSSTPLSLYSSTTSRGLVLVH